MKRVITILACLGGLTMIVGCARTDDATAPATQPSANSNSPSQAVSEFPATQPSSCLLMIDRQQQWFPPACLRLSKSGGAVIARLYTDDPADVLTGKETVNSFDLTMTLSDISEPGDIFRAVWVDHAESIEKQDSPYGIFLNGRHDVLQPLDVTVHFEGQPPQVKVLIQGVFSQYHITEQTPNPSPTTVNVIGFLNATVPDSQ